MKDREAVMKELFDLKRASGTDHAFESCVCLTIIFVRVQVGLRGLQM